MPTLRLLWLSPPIPSSSATSSARTRQALHKPTAANSTGIWLTGSNTGTRVGTDANGSNDANERNLISGNSTAVLIYTSNQRVSGNSIGVNVTNSANILNGAGVVFGFGASNNIIGFDGTGTPGVEGNIIRYSTNGIRSEDNDDAGNRFSANSIAGGTAATFTIGIELWPESGAAGVTANDTDDPDNGPNHVQNFPVITSATPTGVSGTFNSNPSESYTLEFFSSAACHAAGNGGGETYLGSTTVNTDINGDTTFSFPASLTIGQFIAATAIKTSGTTVGDTSEFSACATVAAVDPAQSWPELRRQHAE